jgi:low affinity Fe/Cu permease
MPKYTEPRRRQLDELIRVSAAQNTLIGIENLTEEQIAEIRQSCAVRVQKTSNGAQKRANKRTKAAVDKAPF